MHHSKAAHRAGAKCQQRQAHDQRGQVDIAQLAGPVGEALVMTAAGLAVALPAVLAYNLLGRAASQLEAVLEGFAHDLHAQFGVDAS